MEQGHGKLYSELYSPRNKAKLEKQPAWWETGFRNGPCPNRDMGPDIEGAGPPPR